MNYREKFFDEYKYPNVAINGLVLQNKNKRDVTLVVLEPYNMRPKFYNIEELKKYKGMITWNTKFYDRYKDIIDIKLYLGGQPLYQVHKLYNPIKYSDKINGICAIGKSMKRNGVGDITYLRLETMKNIEETNKLITHYYGWNNWGDNNYMGPIGDLKVRGMHIVGDGFHSSLAKIIKLNQYKFNLCFENCYHEFWSWGYVTEKIICCFEARTIPVYFGCYNIEDLIPTDLYIDFRNFDNCEDLVNYMLSLSESDYIKIVNRAYEFKLETKINDIDELIKIINI
jgi:hypothetical protein